MAKKLTPDELNQELPSDNSDAEAVDTPAVNPLPSNPVGPGLADIMQSAGITGDVFCQDEKALEYVSTAPCTEAQIGYDDKRNSAMRGAAEIQAQLGNQVVQSRADPQYRKQLKEIAEASSRLQTFDSTTYAGGQKINLSADVRDLPNSIDREVGCRVLDKMVGYPQTIEVLKWARSAGPAFIKQPIGWLSQMLAVSSRLAMSEDELPDIEVMAEGSEEDEKIIFEAISKLFTRETAQNIKNIARMHGRSSLYVFRVLVKKACEDRQAIVQPPESSKTKYTDIVLEPAAVR